MLWRRESPWHLQPDGYRPGVRVRVGESVHECDGHRLGAHAVAAGQNGPRTMTQLWDLGVVLVGLVVAIMPAVFLRDLDEGRHPTQPAAGKR